MTVPAANLGYPGTRYRPRSPSPRDFQARPRDPRPWTPKHIRPGATARDTFLSERLEKSFGKKLVREALEHQAERALLKPIPILGELSAAYDIYELWQELPGPEVELARDPDYPPDMALYWDPAKWNSSYTTWSSPSDYDYLSGGIHWYLTDGNYPDSHPAPYDKWCITGSVWGDIALSTNYTPTTAPDMTTTPLPGGSQDTWSGWQAYHPPDSPPGTHWDGADLMENHWVKPGHSGAMPEFLNPPRTTTGPAKATPVTYADPVSPPIQSKPVPDPNASPWEQPQFGPSPISDPAPWELPQEVPEIGPGSDPIGEPVGDPVSDPGIGPGVQPVPPPVVVVEPPIGDPAPGQAPGSDNPPSGGTDPGSPPETVPSDPPARPPKGTKEEKVKVKWNGIPLAIRAVAGEATEFLDILDAFYRALPPECRPGMYQLHGKGGKTYWVKRWNPSIAQRTAAVGKCFDHIDMTKLFQNLLRNEVGDRAVAKVAQKLRGTLKHGYGPPGRGYQFGPWDNAVDLSEIGG